MLDDRPYMREREPRFGAWSVSAVLITVLVGVFALQCIDDAFIRSPALGWLALTADSLERGFAWQFLTFQFLHIGVLHLLFNALGLWFIGRFVESVLGPKRFLLAYLGAGVMGGLLQAMLMVAFPRHYAPLVVGASAGVSGIFALFCSLMPKGEVRWNFVLPVRAEVLLWASLGIALFFTLVPSGLGGSYAHAAHLGGLLAGMAFVKLRWHQDFRPLPWVDWWRGRKLRVLEGGGGANRRRREARRAPIPQAADPGAGGDFMASEVDPILDKIHAHGIQSLTDREKKVLERARAKMSNR